jgi:hypothetical protein
VEIFRERGLDRLGAWFVEFQPLLAQQFGDFPEKVLFLLLRIAGAQEEAEDFPEKRGLFCLLLGLLLKGFFLGKSAFV